MKKYKNLMWACLALLAVPAGAGNWSNLRGILLADRMLYGI